MAVFFFSNNFNLAHGILLNEKDAAFTEHKRCNSSKHKAKLAILKVNIRTVKSCFKEIAMRIYYIPLNIQIKRANEGCEKQNQLGKNPQNGDVIVLHKIYPIIYRHRHQI